jgi:glycosyltransferase involved in cell wall biosynthesis
VNRGAVSGPGEAAPRSARPAASGSGRPRVVLFVTGPRSRVEEALTEARQLYPDHDFAFVTEPECRDWLAEDARDVVFVTPQPFNPFGRSAAELRRVLGSRLIQACIIVVAGTGRESLRYRVFALRLPARGYCLLPRSISGISSALARSSFLGFAIVAVLSRGVRALSWLDAVFFIALARSTRWPRSRSWLDGLFFVALARSTRLLPRSRPGTGDRTPEIVHLIPTIGMGGAQRQLALFLRNRSAECHHRLLVLSSIDRFSASGVAEAGIPMTYLDSVGDLVGHQLEAAGAARCRMRGWVWPLVATVRDCFPVCGQVLSLALYLRSLHPRPDVLHCWLLFANVIGPPAARLAGVGRVITSVRNIQSAVQYNYYDPRWQRTHERITAPLADVIIANAPTVAMDYRAFARVPPRKVVTVPNGIETETARPLTPDQRAAVRRSLGLSPDDVVVGTVARLAKEKDFATFLRTIVLARERVSALRTVIVGEGPLRTELGAMATALGLPDGVVRFLGERHDVAAIVQSYDAFLLTSVIEGMPNAVMESQLLGVPVVATRAGGTVDLIEDGQTGLLAPIGDVEALATALLRVLTDQPLHERISRSARQQIRDGFTAELLVSRTESVYRALLGTCQPRRFAPCAE